MASNFTYTAAHYVFNDFSMTNESIFKNYVKFGKIFHYLEFRPNMSAQKLETAPKEKRPIYVWENSCFGWNKTNQTKNDVFSYFDVTFYQKKLES